MKNSSVLIYKKKVYRSQVVLVLGCRQKWTAIKTSVDTATRKLQPPQYCNTTIATTLNNNSTTCHHIWRPYEIWIICCWTRIMPTNSPSFIMPKVWTFLGSQFQKNGFELDFTHSLEQVHLFVRSSGKKSSKKILWSEAAFKCIFCGAFSFWKLMRMNRRFDPYLKAMTKPFVSGFGTWCRWLQTLVTMS